MSWHELTTLEILPLVPEAVLKKHHCHEPLDGRFRSAARLLQAIYRKDRGLPIGSYTVESGERRKLGRRISNAAGLAGGNFLTPEIAYAVRRELAYREIGAMIEEERLLTNLLSSMPLCFNLFMPLKHELAKATCALHELVPSFAGDVKQILFEHSPGRGSAQFTADHSAFDVFIRYLSPEGRRGFIAIEVKYSETMTEPLARLRPRYDELSRSTDLFTNPDDEALRKNPLQQLWREHMLAQSMVEAGLYDEGTFVTIAPRDNWLAQDALSAYGNLLAEPTLGKVRFLNLTLEDVIEVIRLSEPEHAAALHRRYCDWWLVDGEIELALAPSPKKRREHRAPDSGGREVLAGDIAQVS